MSENKTRFVGLDVHKHYVMVAAVNAAKKVVLPPRKVSLVALRIWLPNIFTPPIRLFWKPRSRHGICTIY